MEIIFSKTQFFYDVFSPTDKTVANLSLQKKWRGFSWGSDFPRGHLPGILNKLKQQKVPVVVVRETGRWLYKAKERLPYLIVDFPQDEHGREKAN